MSKNSGNKLSFREKALESSFAAYNETFEKEAALFKDMGRLAPLRKEAFEKEFDRRYGTSKTDGPIYKQIINMDSTGKIDQGLKRAAETYNRQRAALENKGISLDTEEPLTFMEIRDAYYKIKDQNSLSDKPIKNIGKFLAQQEQIYTYKVAGKIAKLVKFSGDVELIEKYGRIKDILHSDYDRATVYEEVAEMVGYQTAEEFIYPEAAARKSRTKDKPWFTTNEKGQIVDPFGKIIR